MNAKTVIVIRANSLDHETRATKLINSLANNGYLVTLISWDRDPRIEYKPEQYTADRLQNDIQLKFKAPNGIKAFFILPIWWCFIFVWLLRTKWDIAHAIQVISLPPALIAGRLKKKPVIYDMLDTYEDTIILPKKLRYICIKIDKLLMRLSSGVVLADECQIKEVDGIPSHNIVAIYDSPDSSGIAVPKYHRSSPFTLFFGGFLSSEKALNLDKIFKAILDVNDVRLDIAGYGDLVKEIKEWALMTPDKVRFIGAISHDEVLKRSAKADVLFVLRDPIIPVNRYICGSKILEAMMCGKPFLANKGTSTAMKVQEARCGIVVDAYDISDIKKAIIRLRDNPDLCREYGLNARKAYENQYGWHIMVQRLLSLYQNVTNKSC
jgi:glycosyltransferase involved in cell wall biosynthesis